MGLSAAQVGAGHALGLTGSQVQLLELNPSLLEATGGSHGIVFVLTAVPGSDRV